MRCGEKSLENGIRKKWIAVALKYLTQKDAAERLRISTSWLRVLTDRGVIRREEDGSYPWPQVAEDYERYQADLEGGEDEPGEIVYDYDQARARKTQLDADLREDELAVRRGKLIPAEEVLERVRRPLEAVDGALKSARTRHGRAWASRLGISQAEAMDLIGTLVDEIRADLREVFEDGLDGGS